jgi:hypothetical protein
VRSFSKRALEIAPGIVSRRRRHHRRPKIAEAELVEVSDRSLGTVHPDGCLDGRLEPFGELQNRIAGDWWSPFSLCALLLFGDRLANRRQAARRQSFCHELLLRRKGGHELVAVLGPGVKPHRPAPLCHMRCPPAWSAGHPRLGSGLAP